MKTNKTQFREQITRYETVAELRPWDHPLALKQHSLFKRLGSLALNKGMIVVQAQRAIWELAPIDDATETSDAVVDPGKNKYKSFAVSRRDSHDLNAILKEVDEEFFGGFFSRNDTLPDIRWWWRGAKQNTKASTYGICFVKQNLILINFRFNDKGCAREALKFLVYHELLHSALYVAGWPYGHTSYFYFLESRCSGEKLLEDFGEQFVVANPIGQRLPTRDVRDVNDLPSRDLMQGAFTELRSVLPKPK